MWGVPVCFGMGIPTKDTGMSLCSVSDVVTWEGGIADGGCGGRLNGWGSWPVTRKWGFGISDCRFAIYDLKRWFREAYCVKREAVFLKDRYRIQESEKD